MYRQQGFPEAREGIFLSPYLGRVIDEIRDMTFYLRARIQTRLVTCEEPIVYLDNKPVRVD